MPSIAVKPSNSLPCFLHSGTHSAKARALAGASIIFGCDLRTLACSRILPITAEFYMLLLMMIMMMMMMK